MRRRPEGSAWLTGSWISPRLGENCSHWALARGFDSPRCACLVLPVHTLWTLWVCQDPCILLERLLMDRCPGNTQRGLELGECLLLLPSSCWFLWGWEQGVGMEVSGGDVDGLSGLCWEPRSGASCSPCL